MGKLGLFWASLGKFGQVWTSLGKLGQGKWKRRGRKKTNNEKIGPCPKEENILSKTGKSDPMNSQKAFGELISIAIGRYLPIIMQKLMAAHTFYII